MENISQQFIEYLFQKRTSDIPESVFVKATNCFIDYLAVTVAGGTCNYDKTFQYIVQKSVAGAHHVLGQSVTTSMREACMLNAFNAHVLELDDSHRSAMTHLGAPIFSALLALAEHQGKSPFDICRAALIGYEAAVRVANVIQPGHKKRGFHVSGTCCTIGTAMAAASLLDFSHEEFENTLSAAATSAAGLLGVASGMSEQKPYNISRAAVSGLDAAVFGKMFRGSNDILGDSRGFFRAYSDDIYLDKLFEPGYAIETIYQKLYASCRHCHAPIEAMLKIRNNNNFAVEDIVRIDVRIYDLAINGHNHTDISGISSAKQSIPYCVASACIYQDCGLNAFTEEKVRDNRLLHLTKLVRVVEDSGLSKLVPNKRSAIVDVLMKDGRILSERVDYAKGEPENPITNDEFVCKYYSLTDSAGISRHDAEKVIFYLTLNRHELIDTIFLWI